MRLPDAADRIAAFYRGEGGVNMSDTVLLLSDRRTVTIDGLVIIDEQVTPQQKLHHLVRCYRADATGTLPE